MADVSWSTTNQYDQDGGDNPGNFSIMNLHVCALSVRRSLVLVTVLHLDILQFVDLALELALFA
jgi:hypothetical protein